MNIENIEMETAPAEETSASWSAREHKLIRRDGTTELVIILSDDNYYLPIWNRKHNGGLGGVRLLNPEDYKIECYHPSTCPVHRV